MRSTFSFPNPVDETSARLVAAGVVLLTLGYLATGSGWVLAVLAYGFVARVLAGPRFSPLGQLVTRVVSPLVPGRHRLVPGPPKRFAQGVGATLSMAAVIAHVVGAPGVATALVAMITVAALLESAVAFCLGCTIFSWLMRVGLVPQSVCVECADISARLDAADARAG